MAEKPTWLKMKQEEVETLVENLAKKSLTTEKIGLILRDQYGIPTTRVYGKKLSQILREKGIEPKQDLDNAEKNVEKLKRHLDKNKQDKIAKSRLIKKSATAQKLRKYKNRQKE